VSQFSKPSVAEFPLTLWTAGLLEGAVKRTSFVGHEGVAWVFEMALPPAAAANLGNAFHNAIAGQLATQADLANAVAPLATQAQMQAQFAAVQAQLAQIQAQQGAMQAQIIAQMQALLAPHNAPAIAAAASATVQSIVASRLENAHDRRDVAYAVVQRADGTPPPTWPDGFDRDALNDGPITVIDALLEDFGLPHGPPTTTIDRRIALAVHIGTKRG